MTPSDTQKIVIGDTKYPCLCIIKLKEEYNPPENEYNVILLDSDNRVGIFALSRNGKISLPAEKTRMIYKIPNELNELQEQIEKLTGVYCFVQLTDKGKELLGGASTTSHNMKG